MTLVWVRVLGPVQMTAGDGTAVELGPPMQRCVLTLLIMEAGRPVPVERLVDTLWGDAAPQGARRMVQWYVSRLRRVLEPVGFGLSRESGGYRLDGTRARVDVHEFRSLAASSAVAAAKGCDPAQEAEALRQALAFWRGRPLSGLPDSEALDGLRDGLSEERLVAEERLYAAEIAAGNHTQVLAALAASTRDHPLRERLVALRMRALRQAGCPAEALACYESIRRRLASQFGVDPSAELRAEHLAILRADRSAREDRASVPELESEGVEEPEQGPVQAQSPAVGWSTAGSELAQTVQDRPDLDSEVSVARFQLPHRIPDFTGRQTELAGLISQVELGAAGATVAICAVDGMVGVGKTALAVQVAHAVADRFPDGQFFFELHAHAADAEPVSTAAALEFGLRCLGIAAWRIPPSLAERAALWRSTLSGQRVLLILDDVAGVDQIYPLIPPGSGSLAVITSRRRLLDLDAAALVSLDVLPPQDAADQFARMVGPRAEVDPAAVHDVLEACGYLPLAIRIAASRLRHRPQWAVALLARLLEQTPLAVLASTNRGVTGAFAQSYQQLDERGRRVLRQLGLHGAAEFDAAAAAALTGEPEVEFVLESLLDHHLLTQRAPGRYAFHNLVRLCAAARAAEDWPPRERPQDDMAPDLPCTTFEN